MHTNSPRQFHDGIVLGDDHIVCYGGDLQAEQVTWQNSGGGQLEACDTPCLGCGSRCRRNGGVGVDPALNGQTDIHMYTNIPAYVNQDLECRVFGIGGTSAFIGVYLKNGGE